jgi:LuxR family maltose regulon positive regulatory protein
MLYTRLYRPKLSQDLLVREKLIEQLNRNIYKPLTLISAPAGYGKSILVSQWIEKSDIKAAWISLDESFNDFASFLELLVAAVDKILPNRLSRIRQLLNASTIPKAEIVYEEIVNGLVDLEDNHVLVLDDYHLIKNEKIHEFVNSFLKYPPEYINLVIITS